MRNERPGWCRPRKPCESCKDIDDTGLSYLDHTCAEGRRLAAVERKHASSKGNVMRNAVLTADTITDAQIRAMMRDYNAGSISYELCALALCTTPGVTKRFDRVIDASTARGRCAEILNARTKETQ